MKFRFAVPRGQRHGWLSVSFWSPYWNISSMNILSSLIDLINDNFESLPSAFYKNSAIKSTEIVTFSAIFAHDLSFLLFYRRWYYMSCQSRILTKYESCGILYDSKHSICSHNDTEVLVPRDPNRFCLPTGIGVVFSIVHIYPFDKLFHRCYYLWNKWMSLCVTIKRLMFELAKYQEICWINYRLVLFKL